MTSHPLPRLALVAAALAAVGLAPARAAAGGVVVGTVDVTPLRFQDETVVFLKGVAAKRPPARHVIDQRGMQFVPFILAVQQGDTVEFLNTDVTEHEVYSPSQGGFALGLFRYGEKRAHTFDRPGVFEIRCHLHTMQAWVFVAENPFATTVDRKGRFRLEGVPAGTYPLAVWNAHLDVPERAVTVPEGGTVELAISVKR